MGKGKAAPDDLVFCTPEGDPRKPNSITRVWAFGRDQEAPQGLVHCLHRTHVSQLIAAGMDVLTISRRIGHAKPSITLNVYGHIFKNKDSQAAFVIDQALGNVASTE